MTIFARFFGIIVIVAVVIAGFYFLNPFQAERRKNSQTLEQTPTPTIPRRSPAGSANSSPLVPTPKTQKDCPKLDSELYELIHATSPESFATSHALYYKQGRVRVIIDVTTADNTLSSRYNLQVESSYDNMVQALVPLTRLCNLSNDNRVRMVRTSTPSNPD